MVEVKVLMALAKENDVVIKESARNGEWVKISLRKFWAKRPCLCRIFNIKVTIPDVERPWFSKAEGFILLNHDTSRILSAESQRNTIDPSVAISDSSTSDYDSADESSICSTLLLPLKKLEVVDPISRPKTIKSILKSKSTLKAEALKRVIINEPSSAPAKGNKSFSTSKVHSAPASKLKSVKIKDDPPLALVMKELNNLKLKVSKISHLTPEHLKSLGRASSRSQIPRPLKRFFPPCTHCGGLDHLSNACLYSHVCGLCRSYDHDTNGLNRIISLEREINPRNPEHAFKRCKVCGSSTHTITDHYDIEWFKRGETLQAKKAEALRLTRVESSNANKSKTLTKRSINHEKYTLVIVDEYSRYTWVYFLKKKSQAPETILSFIKRVENQNDIKVKQLRIKNGTEFRNSILVNFCDEKSISQNFYSLYTPEQNGFAERKNRTLIEAARTMLSGSIFSKQYWTEAIAAAYDTQNRSTIVKRHLKTPYEIFRKRILNINFIHVFGCPVYIHNHKDHLGKFDKKADDCYLLGYSLVSKAFRVFNTKRQQIEETDHITYDESLDAIKFSKPSVDNINIAETERYPPNEYLYPFEPS
uniref:Retrovirus-related Pol polyprotein from transposon TNT 1-94 n=1 Tax=Tanacetum cinerariifolium TaxID=118510 RepID=A0A6L2J3Q9_TANCI|nr:retrovirus-related Pol polyprotein from transposon TNT 1-94 [Tanacetum cinerariifolium]